MAHPNSDNLVKNIPSCVRGCFFNGVASSGCGNDDYDCWCYSYNNKKILEKLYTCLDNMANNWGESCSENDKAQLDQIQWSICDQYWQETGTADEPPQKTVSSDSKDEGNGLSTGVQAGIGVGVGLGVILLLTAIWFLFRRRNKRMRVGHKLDGLPEAVPMYPEKTSYGERIPEPYKPQLGELSGLSMPAELCADPDLAGHQMRH